MTIENGARPLQFNICLVPMCAGSSIFKFLAEDHYQAPIIRHFFGSSMTRVHFNELPRVPAAISEIVQQPVGARPHEGNFHALIFMDEQPAALLGGR